MTAIDETVAEAPTRPVPVISEGPSMPERLREVRRRAVGIGFVAIVTLLIAIIVVEVPLANVWYSFRQEHVSSQFANPGTPHNGSALAVLQVPFRAINVIVLQGDGPGTLRAGPGHRPSSPLPGELGNSVIFGHDSDWGGPFSKLAHIKKGDALYLDRRTVNGDLPPLFFQVTSTRTVKANDKRPFAASTDHRLTLVTSAVGGKRLVVQAVSGNVGRMRTPDGRTTTATGGVAGTVWTSLAWFALCCAVLAGVIFLGRRRHRGSVLVIAAAPLVLGALLAVILAGDALFRSPLG